MLRTRRLFLQSVCLCTVAISAFCLHEKAVCQQHLTLPDAIALTLKNNQQLAVARNAHLAREKARSELSTTALPQFKAGLSSIYAPTSPSFGYDPVITNEGQVSAQLFAQQSLYDGGMRGLRSDQLTLDITEANIELQSVRRDLKYSVTVAFIDVLRYQEELLLRQESVNQLREYKELAERRFHGGGASESDVLRTEVELSNAVVAFNQARTSYNSARYSLAELLGETIDTSFTVTGTLDSLVEAPVDTLPNRVLDLKLASIGVERSSLDVTLIEREAYPVLSLFADAGLLSSIENLRLPSADRSKVLGYSVGLLVEFPLFDWGGRGLRKEQKELERNSLSTGKTLVERRLSGEMARLRLQWRNGQERLETLRRNATKANDLFLLTKARYAGGSALAVEVLGAQQLVNDSKVAALQTLAEIQSLSARIHQLTTQEE
jgi:outer membrane protein TolC